MLTTGELQDHLSGFSYKPGWAFKIYDGAFEGQHIQITTVVPDTYGNGDLTLDVHSNLPPIPSLDYFKVWLQWRLAIIEVHESREFFKFGGEVVFDPHAENANRDLW